jgi:hypothetical protein
MSRKSEGFVLFLAALWPVILYSALQIALEMVVNAVTGKRAWVLVRGVTGVAALAMMVLIFGEAFTANVPMLAYVCLHVVGLPAIALISGQAKTDKPYQLATDKNINIVTWLYVVFLVWVMELVLFAVAYEHAGRLLRVLFGVGVPGSSKKIERAVAQAKAAGIKLVQVGDYADGNFGGQDILVEEEEGKLRVSITGIEDAGVHRRIEAKMRGGWEGQVESDEEEGYVSIHSDEHSVRQALECLKKALM